jgi:hypothetical protein
MAGTKNRSPRRSTPRHPIAMASTGKSPDPIPCALAAVLLPGSHAHCYHMQKTLFPGRARITVRGAYVLGPCLRAGCAHAAWTVYGSRSDSLGAGRRCLAPWVGGGRWSSASEQLLTAGRDWGGANAWASGGPGGAMSSRGVELDMRGRLDWCGVLWFFQVCCSVSDWGLRLMLHRERVD